MATFAFALLFMLLLAYLSAPWRGAADAPTIDSGSLNLEGWSVDASPVVLSGAWEVVWNQLATPDEFDAQFEGDLFELPARWNSVMGAEGVATFRSRIQLPEREGPFALHMISPHSAWRLYAGGQIAAQNGVPTTDPETTKPHYVSRIVALAPGDQTLVLQVANFGHAYGGPGHVPTVWVERNLRAHLDVMSAAYSIILGVLAALALMHVVIYFSDDGKRPDRAAHLWMTALCLILVYRISGVVPLLHIHFPDAEGYGSLRLTYVSLFVAPFVFLMFFAAVFGERVHRPVRWLMATVCAAGAGASLIAPEPFYTGLRNYAIGLNVIAIAYTSLIAWRATIQRVAGALTVLITNLAFLVSAINDAIIYTDAGSGFDLTPIGILTLAVGYTWALRQRLQQTLREGAEATEAIAALNLQLEQDVADRTRAFQSAANRAEDLAKDRSNFIAAASHDLRQPLHALALFNAALRTRTQGGDLEELVEQQRASITSLSDLLQDTLDAAKLDSQDIAPSLQTVDVHQLISNLHAEVAERGLARGVRFEQTVTAPLVVTDPNMLRRIVGNVVDNALKAAQSRVKLSATSGEDRLVISVEDDGPGIPAKDAQRILEPYVSLDDDEYGGGYGLGLHIVNRFTASLGGELGIERSAFGGAKIDIRLPMTPPTTSSVEPAARAELDLNGIRVLAADDEPEIRQAVEAMLGASGCDVRTAQDLPAARQALTDGWRPDVLLVDYHLANQDGIELAMHVFEHSQRQIPTIVITGATEEAILSRIDAAGFCRLSKPIDPTELNNRIFSEVQRDGEKLPLSGHEPGSDRERR